MSLYCFFYGLWSLVMGFDVLLHGRANSQLALGHQFYWLGGFGILSAVYAWAHMFDDTSFSITDISLAPVYLITLPIAALFLTRFGVGMLAEAGGTPGWIHFIPAMMLIPSGLVIAYGIVVLTDSFTVAMLVRWMRYLLLIPSNLLAALGFLLQWQRLKKAGYSRQNVSVLLAGIAFLVHGFTTGLSPDTTGQIIGLPIEFVRTLSITLVSISVLHAMTVFEFERDEQIRRLELERREAQQNALKIYTRSRQETELWLNAVVKLGRQIAGMDDVDAVLKQLVTLARDVLKADVAMLAVFEAEARLVPKVVVTAETFTATGLPLETPQILRAVTEGHPLRLPEDSADTTLRWWWGDKEFVVEKAALVPLFLNHTPIGILCVGRYHGESFTCSNLTGMSYLADQAVIALEHATIMTRLQSLAIMEERSRIAREMHDGLAQLLGYLGLQTQTLEALVKQEDKEGILRELAQARAMIKSAQADVRENILSLRTTLAGDTSLVQALQQYVEEFGIQTGIRATFNCEADGDIALSPLAQTQCVRIVQEALTNVRKHACATHVWVDLGAQAGWLTIAIADNGVGLQQSATKRQFGLKTMRERAQSVHGTFVIESTPTKGTRINLNLPLPN